MSTHTKAPASVPAPAEAHKNECAASKATRFPRRRARKAEPPSGHLGMKAAAVGALSAAALRLDHRATLRCLESVPPGAWLCDWFIDQMAKHLIRAMRQGRVHEVRNSTRASFDLPVEPEDLRRYCNDLTARYWRAFP